MREIKISTDVFARIWALRQTCEDTEDQILKRVLLGSPTTATSAIQPVPRDGFWDRRHNVHFAEGFEIFRTYKGRTVTAVARNGLWELPDGQRYASLNELSRAVTSGIENAWVNWNFRDQSGRVTKVSELRNAAGISKRHNEPEKEEGGMMDTDSTWCDDVEEAIENLGGKAPLERIYGEVEKIRTGRGATIPPSLDAIIRRELENNSSDSQSFTGRKDLFYSVDGIGGGVWGLRQRGNNS